MDFPLNLESLQFVEAMDEFRQTVTLLLKEQSGNFMQSNSLGALFSVHSGDEGVIEYGIEETLKKINGVTVESCVVKLPNVSVSLKYKDEIVKFQFSVSDED